MLNTLQNIAALLLRTSFLMFFIMLFPFKALGYQISTYKKKLIIGSLILAVGCFSFIFLEDYFIRYLDEYIFPEIHLKLAEFEITSQSKTQDNVSEKIVSDQNMMSNESFDKRTRLSYQLLNKEENETTFSDVAGVKNAKEKLKVLLYYLNDPRGYTRLGARAPKGLLLYGPPGTGKTLLARALAGEAKINFIAVSGASFDEQWVGVGAMRVRELFQLGRKYAPVIIFIDELDALAPSREFSGSRFSGKAETLAEMLNEMDNINKKRNTDIFIVAATNRIQDIDPALLRSGRLDWHLSINLPNISERTEILKIHLKKIKFDRELNVNQIAQTTNGFSGADLENIVNEATTIATLRKLEEVDENAFQEALTNFRKNRIK